MTEPNTQTCCVDGCHRWTRHETLRKSFGYLPREWICRECWASVPKSYRRVVHRIDRTAKRYGWNKRLRMRRRLAWDRIKRYLDSNPLGIPPDLL